VRSVEVRADDDGVRGVGGVRGVDGVHVTGGDAAGVFSPIYERMLHLPTMRPTLC
jgi:hypothetical protein